MYGPSQLAHVLDNNLSDDQASQLTPMEKQNLGPVILC